MGMDISTIDCCWVVPYKYIKLRWSMRERGMVQTRVVEGSCVGAGRFSSINES